MYLYALDPGGKQTIIQAGPLTAETDVNKPVVFLDDIGQFTITKTITGAGAGSQGPIQIDIVVLAAELEHPAVHDPRWRPGRRRDDGGHRDHRAHSVQAD